jgi:hypothetical protein
LLPEDLGLSYRVVHQNHEVEKISSEIFDLSNWPSGQVVENASFFRMMQEKGSALLLISSEIFDFRVVRRTLPRFSPLLPRFAGSGKPKP